MPSENRVRRDDRRDVREDPTAEALTDDGETPTFVVIQPQPPAVQLRLQNAVLFAQEFDDVALLPFEPAEQRRNDQVQRKHARSLRQTGMDAVFGHYGFWISSGARRRSPRYVRRCSNRGSRCIDLAFSLFTVTNDFFSLSPTNLCRYSSCFAQPARFS